MRLSADTHRRIEEFFRAHRGDAGLTLPPIEVHAGRVARWLTALAGGVSGITFGRHVFVRPGLVRRDAGGRAVLDARLLVHEAAHVLQYRESGYVRFFRAYLRDYFGTLGVGRNFLKRAARNEAYLAIAHEREARAAEDAYAAGRDGGWKGGVFKPQM